MWLWRSLREACSRADWKKSSDVLLSAVHIVSSLVKSWLYETSLSDLESKSSYAMLLQCNHETPKLWCGLIRVWLITTVWFYLTTISPFWARSYTVTLHGIKFLPCYLIRGWHLVIFWLENILELFLRNKTIIFIYCQESPLLSVIYCNYLPAMQCNCYLCTVTLLPKAY